MHKIFSICHTERYIGMEAGPIPASKIDERCEKEFVGEDMRIAVARGVFIADRHFMQAKAERRENEDKSNRERRQEAEEKARNKQTKRIGSTRKFDK